MDLGRMLLLLLPLLIIQIILIGVALRDLVRRKRVRGGNKLLWGLVIVFIQYIGPILYLTIGREED